jgi:rifampicin phosphotransferase
MARMAVVVQRMVVPHAAGILFTADPVTSNRKVAAAEAVLGLGEALVSGRADADAYEVRDGEVVTRSVGTSRLRSALCRRAGRRNGRSTRRSATSRR